MLKKIGVWRSHCDQMSMTCWNLWTTVFPHHLLAANYTHTQTYRAPCISAGQKFENNQTDNYCLIWFETNQTIWNFLILIYPITTKNTQMAHSEVSCHSILTVIKLQLANISQQRRTLDRTLSRPTCHSWRLKTHGGHSRVGEARRTWKGPAPDWFHHGHRWTRTYR